MKFAYGVLEWSESEPPSGLVCKPHLPQKSGTGNPEVKAQPNWKIHIWPKTDVFFFWETGKKKRKVCERLAHVSKINCLFNSEKETNHAWHDVFLFFGVSTLQGWQCFGLTLILHRKDISLSVPHFLFYASWKVTFHIKSPYKLKSWDTITVANVFHTLTPLCFKSYFSSHCCWACFWTLSCVNKWDVLRERFSPTGSHYFQGALVPKQGNSIMFFQFSGNKGKGHSKRFLTSHFPILFIHLFFTVMLKLYYRAAFRNTQRCLNCCCVKKKLCPVTSNWVSL